MVEGMFKVFARLLLYGMNDVVIGRDQLPWDENWKLDERFFKDMDAWKKEHPDSTLQKVMERISDAVTKSLPFVELIPDGPFPAGSLVKALAHLLVLGVVCRSLLLRPVKPFISLYQDDNEGKE